MRYFIISMSYFIYFTNMNYFIFINFINETNYFTNDMNYFTNDMSYFVNDVSYFNLNNLINCYFNYFNFDYRHLINYFD